MNIAMYKQGLCLIIFTCLKRVYWCIGSSKNNWKNPNEESKLTYNEQKEYKRLEKDISKLEKQKEKVQQEFLSELSEEEINKKSQYLQSIIDDINHKTERWFELSAKME